MAIHDKDNPVQEFREFLQEVTDDLQSDQHDSMRCLLFALGLIPPKAPTDFLSPIKSMQRGRLAIIPCFHGEAADLYSMLETTGRGRRLALNSLSNLIRRYHVAKSIREEYHRMDGVAPFNADCYEILTTLQSHFPNDVIVDLGFMNARPYIEERVIAAANHGASHVIVVHTMIGVSSHTQEIEERIEGLRLPDHGIHVAFTEPLWNDAVFIDHQVRRILSVIGNSDRSTVGVAILGYGWPVMPSPGKYAMYTLETNRRYAQAYMQKLADSGITNTLAGYIKWLQPDIVTCAQRLAANGARHILFDWYHTGQGRYSLVLLPVYLQKAKKSLPNFTGTFTLMGPQKDSPEFVGVLVNQIQHSPLYTR